VVRSRPATPGAARIFSPDALSTDSFKPIEPRIQTSNGFGEVLGEALDLTPAKPTGNKKGRPTSGAKRSTDILEKKNMEPDPGAIVRDSEADDRDRLRAREIVDMVRQEMAMLRREIRLQQRVNQWAAPYTPLGQQVDRLLEGLGATTAMRTLLIEEVQRESSQEALLEKTQEILKSGLSSPQITGPLTGVQVAMGPSGSGKTQVVARLALQAAEAWGPDQVAVISWSDNRLGAWAQIQMSCAKLGVDCFRVQQPELLAQISQELADRQCVIVDTPGVDLGGHSTRLNNLLPSGKFHLVLPADTTATNAARFLALRSWSSLVVTKLDEATQSWGLVHALMQKPTPLFALAANGPNLQSSVQMSASVMAGLALGQLRDQFAQDYEALTATDSPSTATIEDRFRPTQARLASKAER
jgi:flagellar biosynthesis GTPase FlhF